MNGIADGIMRKDTRSTRLTAWEKERNKAIAKLRYMVEQYFGLSHLHMDAFQARFTRIIRNSIDALFRQMAFNIFRGGKILGDDIAGKRCMPEVVNRDEGVHPYQLRGRDGRWMVMI